MYLHSHRGARSKSNPLVCRSFETLVPRQWRAGFHVRRKVVGSIKFVLFGMLFLSLGVQCIFSGGAMAQEVPKEKPEYFIKAGLIMKFLKFVEWPPDALPEDKVTFGILGKDPFGDLFENRNIKVFGRQMEVIRFGRFKEGEDYGGCQILFISNSEKKVIQPILSSLENKQVLTVSDIDDFIDKGGIIKFVQIKDRIRYEINQHAASTSGLRINSQLLLSAKRVIKKGEWR